MRILSARIFLSLLAGKFDKTEQKLPWSQNIKLHKFNFEHGLVNQILLASKTLNLLKTSFSQRQTKFAKKVLKVLKNC